MHILHLYWLWYNRHFQGKAGEWVQAFAGMKVVEVVLIPDQVRDKENDELLLGFSKVYCFYRAAVYDARVLAILRKGILNTRRPLIYGIPFYFTRSLIRSATCSTFSRFSIISRAF